ALHSEYRAVERVERAHPPPAHRMRQRPESMLDIMSGLDVLPHQEPAGLQPPDDVRAGLRQGFRCGLDALGHYHLSPVMSCPVLGVHARVSPCERLGAVGYSLWRNRPVRTSPPLPVVIVAKCRQMNA